MKTIQLTVNFAVQVPDNTKTDTICINILNTKKNFQVFDETCTPIEGIILNEYETIMVEEI